MRILNTYTVDELLTPIIIFTFLLAVVCFIFILCDKMVPLIISGCVLIVIILLSAYGFPLFSNSVTKYECIVDDNYPAKELHEKYDLVEIKGDIWVLREKEE